MTLPGRSFSRFLVHSFTSSVNGPIVSLVICKFPTELKKISISVGFLLFLLFFVLTRAFLLLETLFCSWGNDHNLFYLWQWIEEHFLCRDSFAPLPARMNNCSANSAERVITFQPQMERRWRAWIKWDFLYYCSSSYKDYEDGKKGKGSAKLLEHKSNCYYQSFRFVQEMTNYPLVLTIFHIFRATMKMTINFSYSQER